MSMKLLNPPGKSSSRRHISHRQHQANHLRKLAEKCDQQIIKLMHRKKSLLELAAKLDAKDQPPVESNVRTIGFK